MRALFYLFSIIGLSGCIQAVNSSSHFANTQQNQTAYLHNLIIFYDANVGEKSLIEAVKAYNVELVYHYKQLNGIAIRLPAEKNVDEAIRYFEQIKGVLGVSQDRVNQLH